MVRYVASQLSPVLHCSLHFGAELQNERGRSKDRDVGRILVAAIFQHRVVFRLVTLETNSVYQLDYLAKVCILHIGKEGCSVRLL